MEKEESGRKGKGRKGAEAAETSVEELILNTQMNKYDAINLSRRWVYELRSKDTESHTLQDMISMAVGDVLGGKVDAKTVRDLPPISTLRKVKASPTSILDNIGKEIPPAAEHSEKKEESEDKE